MKNIAIFSSDDDESPDFGSEHRWWRSDPKFGDCAARLKAAPRLVGAELAARVRVVRELERLAVVAGDGEGLSELRQKLTAYRSGDFWMPTGGIARERVDIPPVATVLLVGLAGAGKSSLINLMYCVLGRSGLVPFAHTASGSGSNYTSMFLQEHNVVRSLRSGFCVYDSRGFGAKQTTASENAEELSDWVSEGVHHNQLCLRAADHSLPNDELEALMSRSSSKFTRRRVNCVMVVADVAAIYTAYRGGDFTPLDATEKLFSSPVFKKFGERPILILTHGDMLSAEERIDARIKICSRLNISETSGVYDIVCLTEYGFMAEEWDPVSAYALAEALYRALLSSDTAHPPKRNFLDWVDLVLSWLLCLVAALFAFLAEICTKLGRRDGRLKLN